MAQAHTISNAPVSDKLDWLEVVRKNVSNLRFGSLQITVHDGRVTQVESIEKIRFIPSRDGTRAENNPT